jgi:hypothetical protein
MPHENRKMRGPECARELQVRRMWIGPGAADGSRQERDGRSAGLGGGTGDWLRGCWGGEGSCGRWLGDWRTLNSIQSYDVTLCAAERGRLRLVAGGWGFWYSLEVCRSAASASMAGVSTTGFRRCVRGVETGVRRARFAFRIISGAESVGSASIRVARVVRIHRSLSSPDRSTNTRRGFYTGSGARRRRMWRFRYPGRRLYVRQD